MRTRETSQPPPASITVRTAGAVRDASSALLENLPDEELMARFQRKEIRAFEVLLARHQRSVYHFIYRFVSRGDLAEDLLQEVFLRVVHSAAGFERRSRFTTWLYTIARNLCIDFLRKKKHRNAASLDQPVKADSESGATLMQCLDSKDRSPDQLAHDRQLRAVLLDAIARLNPEQREVFLMREEAGLPFEEIARIVNAPLNTVKSRMRYALQNLRVSLETQGVGP